MATIHTKMKNGLSFHRDTMLNILPLNSIFKNTSQFSAPLARNAVFGCEGEDGE
jgi:hypothetical protein